MRLHKEALRSQRLLGYRLKHRGEHVATVLWLGSERCWQWATVNAPYGISRTGYADTPEDAQARVERALCPDA